MTHQIQTDFARLGLHDAYLSNIIMEKDTISIQVDWGFLENYCEENINHAIIFDTGEIILSNSIDQSFKKSTNDGLFIPIQKPTFFEEDNWLVITDKYEFLEGKHIFKFLLNNTEIWLQWVIAFEKSVLSWKKFIAHEDWMAGEKI